MRKCLNCVLLLYVACLKTVMDADQTFNSDAHMD
jgi:hypothetical protein